MTREHSVALVTGSSRGIGQAVALELARRGIDVAVNCLSSVAEGEAVCAQIRRLGRRTVLVLGDTRIPGDVEHMVRETSESIGPITLLVNNAVVALQKGFLEYSTDEWRSQVEYKAMGYYLTARAVIPGMLEQSGGVIINLLSTVGERGGPGEIAYAVTNGGAIAMTRGLAAEFGTRGIRVNGVMVNWAENAFHPERAEDARHLPRFALGRVTRLDEVARTVAFLASDEASGITGAIIPVDAGFLLT
ncbi:MAG TPA: SDR family oxidoreductase [Symbiobacteriaceae bacterium]|nr:SDR family oxidoreductase [Symbiobacteriaceae bacterium]